ncbi:beta-lactamase/transpeptidase-like protein [Xylariales sp. PMI_506]|nr:beta-lactamase/transpeptidase-like protein [Xylariales sp. PMI_506]
MLENGVKSGCPGFSAAVYARGRVQWKSAKGLSDIEAQQQLQTSHLFGIGSITKVFVAVVILQLVDESRLSLDSTVGDLLQPEVYSNIDNAENAKVHQLLGHYAGIDSWEDDRAWILHGRGKEMDPAHIWGKLGPLDYIRRPKINAPDPGQLYYANTNFTLLGLIVETITKSTAEAEIRKRILEPLGMDQTFLEGFEQPPHPENIPHRYHWATPAFCETAGVSPAFPHVRENLIDATASNLSFISSATDLVTFAAALRDGKLLSERGLEVMKDWKKRPGRIMEIGHGLFRMTLPVDPQERWLGHSGGVIGFTAFVLWKETGDCVISALVNVGSMHSGPVPYDCVKLILDSKFLALASQLAAMT